MIARRERPGDCCRRKARIDRRRRSRAPNWSASTPHISPIWSSPSSIPRPSSTSCPRGQHHGRERTLHARHGQARAKCWVLHGSIAPTPRRPRSTKNFRTSSRAAPGAKADAAAHDERTRRVLVIGTMIALGHGTNSSRTCGSAGRRRLLAGRHQGNHSAAGDLLRSCLPPIMPSGSRRGDHANRRYQAVAFPSVRMAVRGGHALTPSRAAPHEFQRMTRCRI